MISTDRVQMLERVTLLQDQISKNAATIHALKLRCKELEAMYWEHARQRYELESMFVRDQRKLSDWGIEDADDIEKSLWMAKR